NSALNGLVFVPTANLSGLASIQIVTNDQGFSGTGGAKTATDAVTIHVNAVNDAPVLSMPSSASLTDDTPFTFSTRHTNPIPISDIDAGSSPVHVVLTATGGTLTLSGMTGLTFAGSDGTNDPRIDMTGSLASINAALDGMTFTPSLNRTQASSLQINVNDQG